MLRKHVVMRDFAVNNEIKISVSMVIKNGPSNRAPEQIKSLIA